MTYIDPHLLNAKLSFAQQVKDIRVYEWMCVYECILIFGSVEMHCPVTYYLYEKKGT